MRTAVIGLLTGMIVLVISRKVGRFLPDSVDGKPASQLLKENRAVIRIADAFFASGLAAAVFCYLFLGFAENDFRPLAFGGGISLGAPLVVLHLGAAALGRSARQVVAAYAVHQRVPIPALYLLAGIGILVIVATAVAVH
jgi:hypothetical protein